MRLRGDPQPELVLTWRLGCSLAFLESVCSSSTIILRPRWQFCSSTHEPCIMPCGDELARGGLLALAHRDRTHRFLRLRASSVIAPVGSEPRESTKIIGVNLSRLVDEHARGRAGATRCTACPSLHDVRVDAEQRAVLADAAHEQHLVEVVERSS